jgi:hypothetical protein
MKRLAAIIFGVATVASAQGPLPTTKPDTRTLSKQDMGTIRELLDRKIERQLDTVETNLVCNAQGQFVIRSATLPTINAAFVTVVGAPLRHVTIIASGTASNQVTFQLRLPNGNAVAAVETNKFKIGLMR